MGMKVIGHRGARGLAPENTIASLQKAVEHHADMIEFDLRVTKDNVVVLHHNPKLVDPNGSKHQISNSTYAELKEHKPDLARLEEVLATISAQNTLYVEVKWGVNINPIVKLLKDRQNFWLGSKSQKTLMELHRALPEVPKIVIEPWSGVRAHRRANQVGTDVISMRSWWLWWGFIRSVKRSVD
jgi:glycerophosphoryl diester phosphodiesterase